MTENEKNIIIERLKKCKALKVRKVTKKITNTEKVDFNVAQTDAVSSEGIPYSKNEVMQYLLKKGLPLTQENVDLAAKMMNTGYTKENVNYVTEIHHELEDADDETIDRFLNLYIVEKLSALEQSSNNIMEYTVVSINDKHNGSTDIDLLERTLNRYSSEGWRVKQMFTNEIGVNSSSASINGVGFGTNSTVDQIIIVFERVKKQ